MGNNEAKIIAGLLKQINMKLKKNIQHTFSGYGFTFPQLLVLALLKEHGEMKISEISEKMGLTNSTTSGIIDRLERQELVKRIRTAKDRRVVRVGLTGLARDFTCDLETRMENSFAEIFNKASVEDLKDIAKGLFKLNRILEDENIDVKGE
ncbi:MAG: MarR family winged helix-turn-helix transcriptional regulator [Bacillota bacterium]